MKVEGFNYSVIEKSNNRVCYKLKFEESYRYFQGHFDDLKILPALIQIHLVVELAKESFDYKLYPLRIPRMKFAKPIFPNNEIHLEIIHTSEKNKLNFKYYGENALFSQGSLSE